MRKEELHYDLPAELIAQVPTTARRDSRLLVVDRTATAFRDTMFSSILQEIRDDDVMVFNDTRVVPARVQLRRESGGRIDGLWVAEDAPGRWRLLLRGATKVRIGETLTFEPTAAGYRATLVERGQRGACTIELSPPESAAVALGAVGRMPLPPYIKRPDARHEPLDSTRYQTVYACKPGAVAAPTAGLHFDDDLLATLREQNIEQLFVTLHVGQGTFSPIEVDDLAAHTMHRERYIIDDATLERLVAVVKEGRRIIAVGTTAARVLESVAASGHPSGETNIFIYPPYTFQWTGALITNFHLPESTLLAMIYAFGGTEFMRTAYAHAIAQRYRFFSYGDAMFIQ